MAYNETLAENVRDLLKHKPGFSMKKMFGGVCFLLQGNMACGVLNNDLIVRVGPVNYEASLKFPGTRKFDLTGKAMKGWVMVSPDGYNNRDNLQSWIDKGAAFALNLPPKQG